MQQAQLLVRLIENFTVLPGVGKKSAQRFAHFLLNSPEAYSLNLSEAIKSARLDMKLCKNCYNFSDGEICSICSSPVRSPSVVCVVSSNADLEAMEQSGAFSGKYFVLQGLINPLEGKDYRTIKLNELFDRLEKDVNIKELILALSSDTNATTTALFIKKYLPDSVKDRVQLTRIGFGLSVGSSIDCADPVSLSNALEGRKDF